MLAQLSTQANMTSQKPKRRKGTFFCITGNTSLMGGLNSSKSEYFKEDENDQYVFSPTFRSVGSYEGTFTDIANVYNSRNGKIPRGKVSIGHYTENSNVARNGRVKLVSVVWMIKRNITDKNHSQIWRLFWNKKNFVKRYPSGNIESITEEWKYINWQLVSPNIGMGNTIQRSAKVKGIFQGVCVNLKYRKHEWQNHYWLISPIQLN